MVRAVLKAADLCASEPAHAARMLVDGGSTPRYDHVLRAPKELPYDKWREYDAEDTVRFYALRLHKWVLSNPAPEDRRRRHELAFLNELERELKA